MSSYLRPTELSKVGEATELFRVVLTPNSYEVDVAATKRLRNRLS